jgi:hypothetical protein
MVGVLHVGTIVLHPGGRRRWAPVARLVAALAVWLRRGRRGALAIPAWATVAAVATLARRRPWRRRVSGLAVVVGGARVTAGALAGRRA